MLRRLNANALSSVGSSSSARAAWLERPLASEKLQKPFRSFARAATMLARFSVVLIVCLGSVLLEVARRVVVLGVVFPVGRSARLELALHQVAACQPEDEPQRHEHQGEGDAHEDG